jgi:hypothetical protein
MQSKWVPQVAFCRQPAGERFQLGSKTGFFELFVISWKQILQHGGPSL